MKTTPLTLIGLSLLAGLGCSNVRYVQLRVLPPTDDAATLYVGDEFETRQRIGVAPYTHGFNFSDPGRRYRVWAELPGYVTDYKRISQPRLDLNLQEERHGDEGPEYVEIKLEEDEAITYTTESDAANEWIVLAVASQLGEEQVWDTLVASITKFFPELASMDNEAGYVATTVKTRRFQRGPTAQVAVSNQFFCSIAERSPNLTYKIKFESKIDEGKGSAAFARVFTDDLPLIDELRAKLGIED